MTDMPNCPKCDCEYTYNDGALFVCSVCAYEWNPDVVTDDAVKDAYGNVLVDGDTVVLIKDLKPKGSSTVIKQGTVAKNITLANEAGHNISCKIPGIGSMYLKSEFVKKA